MTNPISESMRAAALQVEESSQCLCALSAESTAAATALNARAATQQAESERLAQTAAELRIRASAFEIALEPPLGPKKCNVANPASGTGGDVAITLTPAEGDAVTIEAGQTVEVLEGEYSATDGVTTSNVSIHTHGYLRASGIQIDFVN